MRIGIYLGDSQASAGGGHVYKEVVFNALVRYRQPHDHTFVVFHWLAETPLPAADQQFHFVSLRRTVPQKLREYAAYRWSRFRSRLRGQHLREDFFQFWLTRRMRQHQVECLWYFTSAAPVKDIPYLITIWDLQHRRQPFWPEVSSDGKWQVLEENYREEIQRAAGVVTGTEQGKEEIKFFYGKLSDHIIVAPMPVPDALPAREDLADDILKNYNLPERFMLYPAQFWPHKNHWALLQAWHLLQLRGEHIHLVLVGADKGNLKYVKSMVAQLKLEKAVSILGFVAQTELEALYRTAHGLVYVTYFGPDNLPPLEAFSFGCPVIASAVAGAREQLGEAAILVDPASPAAIADAVTALISDDDLRDRLITYGRTLANERTGAKLIAQVLAYLDGFEQQRNCWPVKTP